MGRYRQLVALGVSLSVVVLLAGCSTTSNSSTSTNGSISKNQTDTAKNSTSPSNNMSPSINEMSAFQDVNKALENSMSVLQNEPNVGQIGFASDPEKNLFKIAYGTNNPSVTTTQLNQIINTYLKNVHPSGVQNKSGNSLELLHSYNLRVEVHQRSLGGKLLFVGQKSEGKNSITWTKG